MNTWFLRFYEEVGGKRVYRKQRIGGISELPTRRDAEKAVLSLRAKINAEVRSPETVEDGSTRCPLPKARVDHREKAFDTVESHRFYIDKYIKPKWGYLKLSEVRTVAVEKWLESLPLAPGTRTKIRNIMSAIYSHRIRHEWITFNPISEVRTTAKRLREADILDPQEFRSLLDELEVREGAMVLLAGATGLRRSEMFALRAGSSPRNWRQGVPKGPERPFVIKLGSMIWVLREDPVNAN